MLDLLDLLWDLTVGRRFKPGPLVIHARDRGSHVELTLENRGKRKIKIAATQAHDDRNRRHFPDTDLPSLTRIAPGQT